jgi:FkbM family methyltransferase
MNPLTKIFVTLSTVANHPLNRRAKLRSIIRFAVAQIAARGVPGEVCIEFTRGTWLIVPPTMKGATYQISPRVYEFNEMLFVAHFLRANELFLDVGANLGAYTVLASGVARARTLAFEPCPSTFQTLQKNIRLNDLAALAEARHRALGRQAGTVSITTGLGTENYVTAGVETQATVPVEMRVLDEELGETKPVLMKIDVEGFESEVFAGAQRLLDSPSLEALVIERNRSGGRYGFDETALHERIQRGGFTACTYDAERRVLSRVNDDFLGCIIYVRNLESARQRVAAAPKVDIVGASI